MLCDVCKKNEATIHIQEIIGGQKKVIHMCQQCAAAKESPAGFDFGPFNLAEILYKLSEQKMPEDASGAADETASGTELTCSECSWSESMLRKSGKLGCSHCYTVFAPLLNDAFKNMHRGLSHLGKHPAGNSNAAELRNCRDTLNKLQKELQQTIESEEYENAAVLRDKINELKAECDRIAARGGKD